MGLAKSYNIINYGGERVYVEGIKHLIFVSETQISLQMTGAVLVIEGENLHISELSAAAIIKGRVDCIKFEHAKKGRKKDEKATKKTI